jgi:hypothetical protein
MMPLDYFLFEHIKRLVSETNSQLVAELTGCIFSASAQI